MAQIDWKGFTWKSAYGNLSVKELLTCLKGFGPLEVLEFRKPDLCHGLLSLSLSKEGEKEVILYYLEAEGERREGRGRKALEMLKTIFKGRIHVEDPGLIPVENPDAVGMLFWVRMFRAGIIDSLEAEGYTLSPGMAESGIVEVEERIRRRSERFRAGRDPR
ncbi:MAG: hypothetical protein ACLGPL_04795 [Acidobacteriota bacterium]